MHKLSTEDREVPLDYHSSPIYTDISRKNVVSRMRGAKSPGSIFKSNPNALNTNSKRLSIFTNISPKRIDWD
jgi:hypothetical protein